MKIRLPSSLWWAIPTSAFLLLVPLPLQTLTQRWPILFEEIENSAHAPLFALLALLFFQMLRRRTNHSWSAAVAIIGCLSFGMLTEGLQALTGRDASWLDLRNDLAGSLIGILWALAREARIAGYSGRATIGTLLASALLLVVFWPLAWTISAYLYRGACLPTIWRPDSRLLQRFSYRQSGHYPGLVLREVPRDWRPFAAVEVEIQSDSDVVIAVSVRAHDALHNQKYSDRFNSTFPLLPRERRVVRIPIEQIQRGPQHRALDMSRMQGFSVFRGATAGPATFRILEIRLDANGSRQ